LKCNAISTRVYQSLESWDVPSKLSSLEARGLGLDTLVQLAGCAGWGMTLDEEVLFSWGQLFWRTTWP